MGIEYNALSESITVGEQRVLTGEVENGEILLEKLTVQQTYYDSFQPYTTTPGATQVSSGAGLEAAVAAANDGDTIELIATGAYTLSNNLSITKSLTIVAVVDGAYISDGAGSYYISFANDKTVYFKGVEFRNISSAQQIYIITTSDITFERCKFNPDRSDNYGIYFVGANADVKINSCVFAGTWTTAAIYMSVASSTLAVKNCYIKNTSAGSGIWGNGGTVYVFNTAIDATGLDFRGTIGGDYNASTDSTAPGSHSLTNITWVDNYDAATYYPVETAAVRLGGNFVNAPVSDYNGSPFVSGETPIGAISLKPTTVGFIKASQEPTKQFKATDSVIQAGNTIIPEIDLNASGTSIIRTELAVSGAVQLGTVLTFDVIPTTQPSLGAGQIQMYTSGGNTYLAGSSDGITTGSIQFT